MSVYIQLILPAGINSSLVDVYVLWTENWNLYFINNEMKDIKGMEYNTYRSRECHSQLNSNRFLSC